MAVDIAALFDEIDNIPHTNPNTNSTYNSVLLNSKNTYNSANKAGLLSGNTDMSSIFDEVEGINSQTYTPNNGVGAQPVNTNNPMLDNAILGDVKIDKPSTNKELSGYGDNTKPYVNNDGTLSTIRQDVSKSDIQELIEPFKQGVLGIQRDLLLPTQKVVVDGLNALGLNIDNEADKNIQVVNKAIDEYNKKHPDEFIHPSTGASLAAMAILPTKYFNSALKAGGTTGILSFLNSLGGGDDYKTASENAAVGAALGFALAGAFNKTNEFLTNKIPETKAKKLYDYVLDHYNVDAKDAEIYYSDWKKIHDIKSDSYINKIKAIMDRLGDKGAKAKVEAASSSPSATKQIEKEMQNRYNLVAKNTEPSKDIETIANELKGRNKIIKDNYDLVKKEIEKITIPNKIDATIIPEALDDATTSTVSGIKELLSKDAVSANDIADAIPLVNEMVRKTKGTTKYKWNILSKQLDNELKQAIPSKLYRQWRKVNQDYAIMSELAKTNLGKNLLKISDKKITPEAASKLTTRMSEGQDTFKSLEHILGTKTTIDLEKNIINEALGKGSENVSWATLARNIEKKGFVTKEGKQLQDLIKYMRDTFVTDDKMRAINFNANKVASLSDNLVGKALFEIVGKTYDFIRKRLPTEAAKHLRMMDTLQDVLRSPVALKEFKAEVSKLRPAIQKEVVEPVIKQLEYKPNSSTEIKYSNKMYVTKEGTIATNADDVPFAVLHDNEIQLVRDKIANMHGDKVMNKVDRILNSKRTKKILNALANDAKTGDARMNAKKFADVVNREVRNLAHSIQNSEGVKLDKKEIEKIYRYKLQQLFKNKNSM